MSLPNYHPLRLVHLFRLPARQTSLRPLSTSPRHLAASTSAFRSGPAPPRLPKEEQEVFEELQRSSTGAFSTPQTRSPPRINQSPHSVEVDTKTVEAPAELNSELKAKIEAQGDGEELHPNVRRGAAPEFEGERNPKTGEVGGPKNDPLRWEGDWSYNGRVTDF